VSYSSEPIVAHAFNLELGSEVVEGVIAVDRWKLHFESETLTLDFPAASLKVELGKGDYERIYFSDSAQPGWQIYTDDYSILDQRVMPQISYLRERFSVTAGRQELNRRLKITAWFVGVCGVIAWLCWMATGLMVDSMVNRISPEWEKQFGDAAMDELEQQITLIDDTNMVARLAALSAPLIRVMPGGVTNFTFHIAEDPDPNAFALPGGHIVVNTGLLKMVDRPEQLLGVLAHETAHVTRKHTFRTMISATGPVLIFGVFLRGNSGLSRALSDGSTMIVLQGFSQEYETEADELGWKYLVDANIDPRGVIEAFRKLKADEDRVLGKSQRLPQAFQSHPNLDKRIARLEKKWNKLPRKTGFIEFEPDALQTLKPK
jgi:Zn-dependent protease with chaperone function